MRCAEARLAEGSDLPESRQGPNFRSSLGSRVIGDGEQVAPDALLPTVDGEFEQFRLLPQ